MYYYNFHVEKYKYLYTYKSEEKLEIGTICELNFHNKLSLGIIVKILSEKDIENVDYSIKEIIKVSTLPIVPKTLMELADWIKNYYISDYDSILPLMYPGGFNYKEYTKKRRNKKDILKSKKEDNTILNEEQKKAYNEIISSEDRVYLIHGITGSGKTEIYIKLIQDAIDNDEGAIFLVPEIALTPQMIKRLERQFNDIVVFHSKMSMNKKKSDYEDLLKGNKKIVIGARSAIFAPVKNLKYIIIDEEHENTYKQDEEPRYHTKNVAIKRAILENTKVILGSATPSFDTYKQALDGDIRLIELNNRYNNASLPAYEVEDLKNSNTLLTENMLNHIKETLIKDEQVILILNRKAYAIIIECVECGHIEECPYCSVRMIYSKQNNILRCNYCNYNKKYKRMCSSCNSIKLHQKGIGTEQVEEELENIFGKNIIVRMDADSMRTKKELNNLHSDFLNHKYKILVGTQLAAKGLHFPDVTFVGIINADQILTLPDFRAGEKTYQLITQAAGRAGRGEKKGKVLIQTYNPESALILSIINNDYKEYYKSQMEYREAFSYPPYGKIAIVHISDKNESRAINEADIFYKLLEKELKTNKIESLLFKPQKANIYKVSNRYRYNIYIQTNRKNEKKLKRIIMSILKSFEKKTTRVVVDIDPLNMI